MSKIAIDIVLLLPSKMADICIDINSRAVARGETDIPLGKTDYVPHISMLMGVIEEENTKKVIEILEQIHTPPLYLTSPELEEYAALRIEKTSELLHLHEHIVTNLEPFLLSEIEKEYFWVDDTTKILDSLMNHVKNYRTQSTHEKFDPHITLHTKNIEPYTLPLSFTCSQIAFNHVSEKGTCRKIFYAKNLETA